MQLLYDATYDYMVEKIDELIDKEQIVILDYALLPLTKYYDLCDVKLLVKASYESRLDRVQKRDHITKQKYDLRDENSLEYSKYTFDYTICNNLDINNLRKAVGEIYEKSIISGKL